MVKSDTTFNPSSGVGYTFGGGTGSSGGSAVGSYLKSEAGGQTVSALLGGLINFGLTAFSSNQNRKNLQGQANIVAQQGRDALSVEQERTKQAQLALEASRNQGTGAGGNIALYIGLGIAGVVVLGVVIYAVTRRSA
jgi:hypothetical protein